MGIYIKGMEMPKDCPHCKLAHWDLVDGFRGCNAVPGKKYAMVTEPGYSETNFRPLWCPLIDVPSHGLLIDANALIDAIERTDWFHQAPNKEMVHGANSAEHQAWYKEQDIYYAVEDAPTIIQAGEEEES